MILKGACARCSIVGGEEVTLKEGILKRRFNTSSDPTGRFSGTDSGSASPVLTLADSKTSDFALLQIPSFRGSPHPSAPITLVDQANPKADDRPSDSM